MARPKRPEKPTLLALLLQLSGVPKTDVARESTLSRTTVDRVCAGTRLAEPNPSTWTLLSFTLTRMLGRTLGPDDVRKLAGTRVKDALRVGEEIDAVLKKKSKGA